MAEPRAGTPVWEDEAAPGFPPLEGDAEADVCVVGLGGSGLACLHALLDLGVSVIGIDAGMVAGGAAGRNGGFLLGGTARFHHDAVASMGREAAVRWYRATLAELDRFADTFPDLVRRPGSLRIANSPDEEQDCAAQFEAMRADGLPVESYEGREGRGLLFPADGTFQPLRRCRRLAVLAARRGARLHEHTPAVALAADAVRTATGRIACRHVLVLVDGRIEAIAPELSDRVRTARLQMLATAPAPDVRIPRPVYARWGYEYYHQLPDGRVALGGFRDRAGSSEWTHDAVPTAGLQVLMEQYLRDALGVHAPITHRWAACVAFTTDDLPIVGRLGSGAWIAGGYSGTGNLVGALCGRGLAHLAVTGKAPELDGLLTSTPTPP